MFESLIEPPDDLSPPEVASPKGRPIVAVIGGGASGTLAALHLAARPHPPGVRLFEQGADVGRGLAYGAAGPDHLLNVRAGAMSAFQDRPDHFADWLDQIGAPFHRDAFVPRPIYGAYLGDLVRQAMDRAGGGDLIIDHDGVVAAEPVSGCWRLTTRDGRRLSVDAVVLATGHGPPEAPPGLDPALAASRRYVEDPWDGGARLADLGERVLIIGTGLTMVDIALSLAQGGRRVTAVSRRGRTPEAHAEAPLAPVAAPAIDGSPLALLRQITRASGERDWRAVVDSLRPHTQAVWAAWSPAQRASFLRHARCWWDVRRHRVAPEAGRRIADLRASGALRIRAARVRSLRLGPDGVEALLADRGGADALPETFDAVVNCMGRNPDVERSPSRVLGRLLSFGLIRPDPSGFGVEVDARSRPVGLCGRTTPGLYAAGPLTQGRFWEITAVPDIRVQTRRLADEIGEHLRSVDHASVRT